ncbi:MAG: helix-turn-helix domain-containing protein [Prevotellaceae bacterium]|jgi:AraC-like DNA-binding protein|nr:helix-turn-helix domain-containing protein [Prevotellaceae bacterium]
MKIVESTDSRLSCDAGRNKLFYGFNINIARENIFDCNEIPHQLSDGGVFICRRGESEFFLDLKSYKLKAGDMCVAFPFSILQMISASDDFEGFGMGAGIELFNDIQIPSLTDYYLYIKDNPCISLSETEQKMLTELCRQMILKYECIEHPFRMEIVNSMFRIVYCEIAAIYKKGKPIVQGSVSRKDMIFRKFLFLISKNYLHHREVDYYAGEMCMTPRYLSSVVKEKSGASALGWINGMVIRQAKSLLKANCLSVQQISDELNFANPSFFGQYFKKYTGMTPKKFRDSGR